MRDYTNLSREQILEEAKKLSLGQLKQMREQLLAYGYSETGILMFKLQQEIDIRRNKKPQEEPDWPGKNLPPITGEMRG